jgi:phage portal protein BeeE
MSTLQYLNVDGEGRNPIMAPPDKKESGVGHLVYLQSMGQPVWTPRNYEALAREGYVQNVIAYRCIRMIAEAAASIPLLVYKDDAPVDKHPFYDLWAYPNPFEGQGDVLDAMYSFLLIAGNSYLEFVTSGKIQELYVLRPDRMKVMLGPKGWPAAYE